MSRFAGLDSIMKCIIFRCSKKAEMYLYVPFAESEDAAIERLPSDLMKLTGRVEKVMELELSPGRTLARVSRDDVVAGLKQKGFFIQMPPSDILQSDSSVLDQSSDTF